MKDNNLPIKIFIISEPGEMTQQLKALAEDSG